MPSSNLLCAPEVIQLVHEVDHTRVLDVGPGYGKYGVLLREYTRGIERLDAVEAWAPYVDERLRCVYNHVYQRDVLLLSDRELRSYDVVLMVDVIEHLAKGDALALLERIEGSVVICTPRDWFQNPEADEIWSEAHRSHWTVDEFAAMERCERSYVNQLGAVMARLGRSE